MQRLSFTYVFYENYEKQELQDSFNHQKMQAGKPVVFNKRPMT